MLEIYQPGYTPPKGNYIVTSLEIREEYRPAAFDEDLLRRWAAEKIIEAAKQGAGGVVLEIRGCNPGRIDCDSASKAVISEIRRRALLGTVPESIVITVDSPDGYGQFREEAGREAVVCLGDSITYGFPYDPESSWVHLTGNKLGRTMINRGINGDTTESMLYRFNRHVAGHRPSHVVVMGGINDALTGVDAGEIKGNIEKIVDRSFANGICPVIGITTPLVSEMTGFNGDIPPTTPDPCSERGGVSPFIFKVLEELRRGLWRLASDKGIPVIDFCSALSGPGGGADASLFVDGGHPNREGYRRMATAAEKTLSRLI